MLAIRQVPLAASFLVIALAGGSSLGQSYGDNGAPAGAQPLTPSTPPSSQRQIVAGVEILGVPASRQQEVHKHLHTKQERDFDPEVVQGDVRRLHASGLYRDVKTFKRDTPDGVVIIYQVFERPRIRTIRHLGNRGISDKKLTKEHGLNKGDPLSSFDTENARRVIEDLYHRTGYPKATVEILEGDRPGDENVVFVINEGQLQRVDKVVFEGNTIASDDRLETQIESKPGILWYFIRGKVDREKIEADVQKLTAYYRSLGYFSARVGRELIFSDDGKWLTIKFIIDEGPRYTVRNVAIEGTTKFRTEPLLGAMELKQGEFFSQDEMYADQALLTDLYGSIGHAFADIQADLRFLEEPGELDLVYNVKEGDVFHVGNINVRINGDFPHTRETVILNRLSLRHGDLVDMREIRNSERRLKASQLFVVNPAEGDPPHIDVKPPRLDAINRLSQAPRNEVTVRAQNPDEPTQDLTPPLPATAAPSIYAPFAEQNQQPPPRPRSPVR